ncbi:nucleoredoxin-like protein 2 [Ornithodoros turicata]|uniref:Putative 16 kDa thioredoxion n=1 Tax=Ornithodoros turicata TaxID=34597 RepID=A0A2R5LNB0_9ACAR
MELFKGKTLVKKDGSEVRAEDVLTGKKVVAIYFSAHWCPPCRMFTPFLAETYQELKDDDVSFEVVFVSSDRSASDMLSYMKECHGDWQAVKYGDELAQKLKSLFGVSGIPMLVVVKEDGSVITKEGRNDVQTKGPAAFRDWFARA